MKCLVNNVRNWSKCPKPKGDFFKCESYSVYSEVLTNPYSVEQDNVWYFCIKMALRTTSYFIIKIVAELFAFIK